MIRNFLLFACFFPLALQAQLAVTVLPVKATGQKAIVLLALKNNYAEKIESARAVCFLLDDQGKMVGQATKWVLGATSSAEHGVKSLQSIGNIGTGFPAGAKTTFNFVVPTEKTASTNLTAKVQFSRVILEGGKSVDPTKSVQIVSSVIP